MVFRPELPEGLGVGLVGCVLLVLVSRSLRRIELSTELRFGLLATEGVPAVWLPDGGRLAEIDRDVLVTMQTVLMTAAGQRR